MGTTTSRRHPEVLVAPSATRVPSPAPLGDAPLVTIEVLIREARRRQRRRWAFSALALVAAIGLVAGLESALAGPPPSTKAGHGPAIASPGEVAAFLARAEKGLAGRFLLRYAVQRAAGPKGTVVVAQLSRARWAYLSTPSIIDIHDSRTTSSVFVNPSGQRRGRYFCQRAAASSSWNCANFSTALMGENAQLLGPYPPTALVLGLQDMLVDYSGKTTGEPTRPAYLVVREVGSRRSSCLAFGNPADPAALVCLDAAGVVKSYDVPSAAIDIGYSEAELRSQSRDVPDALLALPRTPSPARSPVSGGSTRRGRR